MANIALLVVAAGLAIREIRDMNNHIRLLGGCILPEELVGAEIHNID